MNLGFRALLQFAFAGCSGLFVAGAIFAAEPDYYYNNQVWQIESLVAGKAYGPDGSYFPGVTVAFDMKSQVVTSTDTNGYRFSHWRVSQWNQDEFIDGTVSTNWTKRSLQLGYSASAKFWLRADVYYTNQDYTVTFKDDTRTVEPASKTVYYLGTYGELPAPQREGYDFTGWYLGSERVEATTQYTHTSNVTLNASWSVKSYTVTAVATNCNLIVASTGVYNSPLTISWGKKSASGYDYSFVGMTVDGIKGETRTNIIDYGDSSPVEFTMSDVNGGKYYTNIVVTVNYTKSAHHYTIEYDGNGGSPDPESQWVSYDEVVTLPDGGVERTGYALDGWNLESPSGEFHAAGSTVSKLVMEDDGSCTFYAHWVPNVSTNVYLGNGATAGTMSEQVVTNDVAYRLLANQYVRTGYEFQGWSTNGAAAVVYADQAEVSNLTAVAGGRFELNAEWSPITYTCSFEPNGATSGTVGSTSVNYGVEFALPSNGYVYAGHRFLGWSTNATGSAEFAAGTVVSNLTAVAGDNVAFYAIWLDRKGMTDLNDAVDYYGSIVTNRVLNPSLGVEWQEQVAADAFKGGSYAHVAIDAHSLGNTKRAIMQTVVTGSVPVSVSFRLKGSLNADGGSKHSFLLTTNDVSKIAQILSNPLTNFVVLASDSWQAVTVPLAAGSNTLSFVLLASSSTATCEAKVDALEIVAAGYPVPGPENAPVISGAALTDEGLGISFVGDSRFNYQLLGTELLSPADWQPVSGTLTGGQGQSQVLLGPIDPSKSSMFYKVQVLQKQ